jgi:hypothetical protein
MTCSLLVHPAQRPILGSRQTIDTRRTAAACYHGCNYTLSIRLGADQRVYKNLHAED